MLNLIHIAKWHNDLSYDMCMKTIPAITNIEIMSGNRITYHSQPLLCKYDYLS